MISQKDISAYNQHEADFAANIMKDFLSQIGDTLAPSQAVKWTRSKVISRIIRETKLDHAIYDPDYLGTGNGMLYTKNSQPAVLFIAHLDQVSYLVEKKISDRTWRLIPYCKHISTIKIQAAVLRFDLSTESFIKIDTGTIKSELETGVLTPNYISDGNTDLQSGDRIVYESPMLYEGDLAKGVIDNAAGAAACLAAAIGFYKEFPTSNVGFVFSDEEEGPTESLLYFARGVRRLMRQMVLPEMCIIIDGHGGGGLEELGQGTFYTEKTAGGIATVTPPDMFMRIKALAADLNKMGIALFEDRGRVSRSDDIPCLEVTPNVISVGYPSVNRHFDLGLPAVSLSDLENLSKVIYWLALKFGKNG